jgi:tRNA-dihydrouridine synthase B
MNSQLASKMGSCACLVGLSPMDGITDEPFRRLVADIGSPDLIFTEFVSAEGLAKGGVKLYDKLLYRQEETPIVGQLFGKDPDSFYKAAYVLTFLGFDGIDINLGCPAKTVTHHGSGAALIGHHDLVAQIISTVNKGVDDCLSATKTLSDLGLSQKTIAVINRNLAYSFPSGYSSRLTRPVISIKTRLGIDSDISSDWVGFLSSLPLDLITLHGRTLKQGYSGHADWQSIFRASQIARSNGKKFFGNGDVQSRSQALEYCRRYQVDGVLIGRASLGHPWLFKDQTPSPSDRYSAMLLHAQYFRDCFPSRPLDSLRRHFLSYVSGLKTAKALRQQIVRISNFDHLLSLEAAILNC